MAKVLISPGKYVQGAGEMKKLGVYAEGYGTKALILISEADIAELERILKTALLEQAVRLFLIIFMENVQNMK